MASEDCMDIDDAIPPAQEQNAPVEYLAAKKRSIDQLYNTLPKESDYEKYWLHNPADPSNPLPGLKYGRPKPKPKSLLDPKNYGLGVVYRPHQQGGHSTRLSQNRQPKTNRFFSSLPIQYRDSFTSNYKTYGDKPLPEWRRRLSNTSVDEEFVNRLVESAKNRSQNTLLQPSEDKLGNGQKRPFSIFKHDRDLEEAAPGYHHRLRHNNTTQARNPRKPGGEGLKRGSYGRYPPLFGSPEGQIRREQQHLQELKNKKIKSPKTSADQRKLILFGATSVNPSRQQVPTSPPQPDRHHLRRIEGMVTTVYEYTRGIVGAIWGYFRGARAKPREEEQIIAVETDGSGKKRRAIAVEREHLQSQQSAASTFKVPQPVMPAVAAEKRMLPSEELAEAFASRPPLREMPCTFPETQSPEMGIVGHSDAPSLITPPDSRPGSSQEAHEKGMKNAAPGAQASTSPAENVGTGEQGALEQKKQPVRDERYWALQAADGVLPACVPRPVVYTYDTHPLLVGKSRPSSSAGDGAAAQRRLPPPAPPAEKPSRALRARLPAAAREWAPPKPRASQTEQWTPGDDSALAASALRNSQKDDKVDALIDKTKRILSESPEEKAFRESWRSRAILKKEAEEAARQKAEQELEDARRAEEARIQAEEEEKQRLEEEERKKTQPLIQILDSEWEEKIEHAMAKGKPGAHLATSIDGVELSRKDFGTVLPQSGVDNAAGWLNDEIVNAFVGAISARRTERDGWDRRTSKESPAFVSFGSQWYTTWKQKNGYAGIKNWAKGKKILGDRVLGAEKIFFPVNTGAHWMLLIISPKARTIEFLDSLHTRQHKYFFSIARTWLACELGSSYKEDEWKEVPASSAWQKNTNDCGVFVCMNALASGKGVDFAKVGEGDMEDARKMVAAVLLNGGLKGEFEL